MKKLRPVLVLAVCLVLLGGAWLWARPRTQVEVPPAGSSPAQVVASYVEALNARDFDTVFAIAPSERGVNGMSRWSLHPPRMTDFRIVDEGRVVPADRSEAQTVSEGDWADAATVQTIASLHHFDGTNDVLEHASWSFHLARHGSDQPWQIVDQGQG